MPERFYLGSLLMEQRGLAFPHGPSGLCSWDREVLLPGAMSSGFSVEKFRVSVFLSRFPAHKIGNKGVGGQS